MTSSFTDLGNIGTGKNNGIADENNLNNARRAFLNGTIGPNQDSRKPMTLDNPMLSAMMMQNAANQCTYEINPPSYNEEEAHYEAAYATH